MKHFRMEEWLLVDLAPAGGEGFTRDAEMLKSLFENFPVDSGWTLLSPPLEILEHRHLDFSEILESAGGEIEKIPIPKIRELASARGFPAMHRRELWFKLLPTTWKFLPERHPVQADVSVQIEKDIERTQPEKVVADFPGKLRRVLNAYAAHK